MTNWMQLWKGYTNRSLVAKELQALDRLDLEPAQASWLLWQYRKVAAYPNAQDFLDWVEGNEPPSEVVAAAFLTEQPLLVTMGQQLQTLESAWYPTAATKQEIEDLKRRLRTAL